MRLATEPMLMMLAPSTRCLTAACVVSRRSSTLTLNVLWNWPRPRVRQGNLTTAAKPKFERQPCYGVHAQGLTTTPHPTARITKFREAPVLEGLHKNLRECVLFIVQSGTCRRRAWHLGRDVNCGL